MTDTEEPSKPSRVRLLIDENLPPSLKSHLADLFPRSIHVRDVDLTSSPDSSIWQYAKTRNLTILTKDSDFAFLAQYHGSGPPTAIQIRAGNCSVSKLVLLIRENAQQIATAVHRGDALYELSFVQAASEASEA